MTRRMVQPLLLLASALALAGCNTGVATHTDLVDVESGAGVAGSGTFKAPGTWDLKLSYDCTRQLAENVPGAAAGIGLTVYNADDQSEAFEHPQSQWKATHGNQLLHFKRSGPYSVAVDSKCDWHLVVVDTSANS
jgi:hypothetical protein